VKRSKEERLVSQQNAKVTQDIIKGNTEIYKNRFKNGGHRPQFNPNIKDIDDEFIDIMDEVFAD